MGKIYKALYKIMSNFSMYIKYYYRANKESEVI